MPSKKKTTKETEEVITPNDRPESAAASQPAPETIQISKSEWDNVQEQLKKLTAVADKGRMYNYESQNTEKKPARIKLSVYKGGLIVGWRTLKDELIKHPTTGRTVGEEQEYEVLILDAHGDIRPQRINSYVGFSEARYTERVEAEIVGKQEDLSGHFTFKVRLDDGRVIDLDSRFVN